MIQQDFAGKIVLVTGGAKNVGKAISRSFAERGAHVIVNFFHSLDASKQTVDEFRALGFKVDAIRASVAQRAQVDRLFDQIEATYGRLDVLVNNAASGALLSVDEIDEEHIDRAIDTNLKGAFWCSRRARDLMARHGGGSIVNVSSVGATLVPANYLVVGTSKAALESLTRYLAVDFAPLGIRVNTASATLIDGDVAEMFPRPEDTKRSSIAATPLKRLATASELAELVAFLASGASRWITGQVIVADGGLSLCSEGLSPRDAGAIAGPAAPLAPTSTPVDQVTPHAPCAELPASDAIAVVGMGLTVPGANDPEGFWTALLEGAELFGNVPADRWDYRSFYSPDTSAEDKSYQSRSVFLENFVPHPRLAAEMAAGTAPSELTTLWLRHALLQAMDGVRLRPQDKASFLVGYTADGSQHLEEAMVMAAARQRLEAILDGDGASAEERDRLLAEVTAVFAARYRRGAEGLESFFPHRVGLSAMHDVLPGDTECMMVDTACSSSLYSIDIGIKGLRLGKHDVAVCGGAFALAPRGSVLFSKLHGLSRSGEVRPLDKDCDGVLFADGAGVVVLKRLDRALADGDRVLGILEAFGSSSDGKGKAIYAPNSAGQGIAIQRAYESVAADRVDWIVAHATGTPAGDLAEFQSLRAMAGRGRSVQVTSNKSLVGHTGWAAGVVSLIQVLLALRHAVIPPQHRFAEAPKEFEIESSGLQIPTRAVAWDRKADAPRVAAVSGFGFGGTNGHLVVAEYRPDLAPAAPRMRPTDEPLVIVGWAAKFPGLATDAEVAAWLRGEGGAPAASFGDSYPIPPFSRVRMPGAVLRAIDRCQLMSLDAAHDLRSALQGYWDAHAGSIGVIMGHMGPTRNAALYASRCYLDDLDAALDGTPLAAEPRIARAMQGLRQRTQVLVAPTTENSFPGMMPNVIPARVANYHDLHGANMTVDAGHASTLAAFEVAARYLRCGDLDMALVGGINGNTSAEVRSAFDGELAEGVALFAVTTAARAARAGLAPLAYVDSVDVGIGAARQSGRVPNIRTYAGADGAIEVLRAIVCADGDTLVTADNPGDRRRFALRVRAASPEVDPERHDQVVADRDDGVEVRARDAAVRAIADVQTHARSTANRTVSAPLQAAGGAAAIPPDARRTDVAGDGLPLALKRYRVTLQPTHWRASARPLEFLAPQAVIVTDDPDALSRLPMPDGVLVLSMAPLATARAGWHQVAEADEAAVRRLVGDDRGHVRMVTSLGSPDGALGPALPRLLALHSLAFLALKAGHDAVAKGGSFIALLHTAVVDENLHPDAGLFGGFAKALAIEMPAARSLAVFTATSDLAQAVRAADREACGEQLLPVVVIDGARRLTPAVVEDAGQLPEDARAPLDESSVVVAIGGARGITAELMKALASAFRPTLYLVGSRTLGEVDPALLALDDKAFVALRPQYIREQRVVDPTRPVPAIIKAFEHLAETRAALLNLEAMRAASGAHKVHYLQADVLDPQGIQAAIDFIAARSGQVDLLVNAAGLNRSASVQVKSLHDFVAVRDIKVRGHANLRAAFAGRLPRRWCNFGSFIGLTGQSGETDYASGNDFLNTQAAYARAVHGLDEFTMGWTLWRSVGLGSNPVTRAFLEKSGLFTSMRTEEGVHHFLRELCIGNRAAASVHLGDAERAAIVAHRPTFFDAREAVEAPAARVPSGRFYVDRCVRASERQLTIERTFDLDRDCYLTHHVVNGFATLPGTFVTELGAEAACQLLPGLKVIGFEDAVFHHFLRVYDARRPSLKRIAAEVVRQDGDLQLVQVRVTGDVHAPNGTLLVRDKLHFEIKVILAPSYASAPIWAPWSDDDVQPVPDPYHMPAAPVHLTGPFVSTAHTGIATKGKRARYALDTGAFRPAFAEFIMPTILLDGLARVAALNIVAGEYVPLAAPASIRRIDVYEEGNDLELAHRHSRIDLYATPRDFALEGAGSRNRFVAVRPDGRMCLQMKDVTGVVIGYVHRLTGDFVNKADVDALVAAAPRVSA